MFPHHCGAKVLPAVVHPTKCCVTHSQENFIQPHIYPSHTTHVNHQVIQHQNFYPHTDSFVNEVNQVVAPPMAGPGFVPGGFPGGFPGGVPGGFPGYPMG
jgi:spore coat protein D